MFRMYSGFGMKSGWKPEKRRSLLTGIRALTPLFFVVGSGVYPADGGNVFSELANLPAVTISEHAEIASEASSVPVQSNLNDESLTRCRWKTDRVLLSSLGQKTPRDSYGIGCTEEKDAGADAQGENRGIREKVLSLTSEGYPLSTMAGSISAYDPSIAGLIVGIAKKESDWGRRTPKLRGEECFNYWGYRGYGNRGMTEDGYGCFEKPDDAVRAIGNRLIELSSVRGGSTDPERMVVWKCGSSCGGHSPESVKKWISDVRLYYQQFAGTL